MQYKNHTMENILEYFGHTGKDGEGKMLCRGGDFSDPCYLVKCKSCKKYDITFDKYENTFNHCDDCNQYFCKKCEVNFCSGCEKKFCDKCINENENHFKCIKCVKKECVLHLCTFKTPNFGKNKKLKNRRIEC